MALTQAQRAIVWQGIWEWMGPTRPTEFIDILVQSFDKGVWQVTVTAPVPVPAYGAINASNARATAGERLAAISLSDTSTAVGSTCYVGTGHVYVIADAVIANGQRIKAAQTGRITGFVDASLAYSILDQNLGGGDYGVVGLDTFDLDNQPFNAQIEVLAGAGDLTQTVTVFGLTAGGVLRREVVTLNEANPVTIPNGPYVRALGISVSALTAANVVLRIAGPGATLVTVNSSLAITFPCTVGIYTPNAATTAAWAYNNPVGFNSSSVADNRVAGVYVEYSDGTTGLHWAQLNGTNFVYPVYSGSDRVRRVYNVLLGDVAVANTIYTKRGAEEPGYLEAGYLLEATTTVGNTYWAEIY